jgi:DNA-binding NarL/FixJ family response regulator
MMVTYGLVAAMGCLGRPAAMADAAVRGYEVSRRTTDAAWLRYGLVSTHIVGLNLSGHLAEAERVAQDCYVESLPVFAQLYAVAALGQSALAHGKLRTAIRWLREARAGLSAVEAHGHEYLCLLHLTQALAKVGDPAARTTLDELDADLHPAFVFLDPEVLITRAWVAASEGMLTEALRLTRESAAVAVARGQPAHEVLALHTAACFGDRGVAKRLHQLANEVDGPRAPAATVHAEGVATADGDALVAASRLLEDMGDLVSSADAAAQAALAYQSEGRTGSAHAAAARAHDLAEACEGARTPAVIAAARPLPFTPREREIVALVATGMTNRQIAERLVVSVRTVEGHLYNAQAKLGCGDRRELAELLRDT